MLKLKFIIKKDYLLIHALKQAEAPFPQWKNLQNRLWKKFPDFLCWFYHPDVFFLQNENPSQKSIVVSRQIKNLIEIAIKSKEFQRLYRETEKYADFVEKQWNQNKEKALTILENILGLKIPDKTITVFITHPNLRRGVSFPEYNAIGWGCQEKWKNYSTVYLCHEILHILTENKAKNSLLMHALIELATDDELIIRLNKKGKYFQGPKPSEKEVPPYVKQLWELKKKALPYWKSFLIDRKNRNILDLEKEMGKKI